MSNITDIGYIGDISTDISDMFIPVHNIARVSGSLAGPCMWASIAPDFLLRKKQSWSSGLTQVITGGMGIRENHTQIPGKTEYYIVTCKSE